MSHHKLNYKNVTRTTPPKPRVLGCRKVCLSCNFGQWCSNLALLASQSFTSPSLLPVKNKLVWAIGDIFVTLPSRQEIHKNQNITHILMIMAVGRYTLPKCAFGMYQSIPPTFSTPNLAPVPTGKSVDKVAWEIRWLLSKLLCLLLLPVAIYRKSWSPTSPPLPPVNIRGETELFPTSLSKTQTERAPPAQKVQKFNKIHGQWW